MSDSLKTAFELAANENIWGGKESVSGPGSDLLQTKVIRQEIPRLLKTYAIKKMLDAPCGDLFWMKEILPEITDNGTHYTGADIVLKLIEQNKTNFSNSRVDFKNIDLTSGPIPCVDLIFTRDCFIHLSFYNILAILENYKRSGSTYLLVSTYTDDRKNTDVNHFYLYGRALNMQKFPFYFGLPIQLITEGCTEGNGAYADKSLGLWKLSSINTRKIRFFVSIFSFFSYGKRVAKRLKRIIKG
jgi:hypothetical protein